MHSYIIFIDIISKIFMSFSDQCITCNQPFDYSNRIATNICAQNHFVCQQCAYKLYSSQSKCPYCLGPLLKANPYGSRQTNNFIYPNNNQQNQNTYVNQGNNHYNQKQNQPFVPYAQPYFPQQNHQNNQQPGVPPFQPQLANANNRGGNLHRTKMWTCLSVSSILLFLAFVALRIVSETCQFWGYEQCGYGFYQCCPYYYMYKCGTSDQYYYCDNLILIQNFGLIVFFNFGIGLFLTCSVVFTIMSCKSRRFMRNRNPNTNNNYVRV